MIRIQKQHRFAVFIGAVLLFANLLRLFDIPAVTMLRSLIYTVIIAAWGISVHNRVIHPQIRRIFTAIAVLMGFWFAVRTVKFFTQGWSLDIARYCWYLYYGNTAQLPK